MTDRGESREPLYQVGQVVWHEGYGRYLRIVSVVYEVDSNRHHSYIVPAWNTKGTIQIHSGDIRPLTAVEAASVPSSPDDAMLEKFADQVIQRRGPHGWWQESEVQQALVEFGRLVRRPTVVPSSPTDTEVVLLRAALNRMLVHFVGNEDLCIECGAKIGSSDPCDTCYVIDEAVKALARPTGVPPTPQKENKNGM